MTPFGRNRGTHRRVFAAFLAGGAVAVATLASGPSTARATVTGAVTVSGEEVEVFGHGVPGVVNAKFLFPDDGGWRQASFIFGASSTSCLPERRRVRDLVLGSLADRG